MRRTPPAPTTPSPWAATILPAAAPRRPSRFSRPEKPAPDDAPGTSPAEIQGFAPAADQVREYAAAAPLADAAPTAFTPAPSAAPAPASGFGPVDRFGIPIAPPPTAGAGYAPAGYPPGPSGTFGPPPQWAPPPTATGWPTAAKVAIGLIAGVIACLIVLAVAIPVFLNQRDKPANRPVALPTTLLGVPQLHNQTLDGASTAVLNQVNLAGAPWTAPAAAYYGQDTVPEFAVVAAKATRSATSQDEKALFQGVSLEVTLTPEGSGPYGGKMECGPATSQGVSAVICASIDSGAFVETVMFGSATNSEAALLSRQIISAVEGGPSLGSSTL